MNPRCAPERVSETHPSEECLDLWVDPGPPTPTASALASPVEPETMSVPADNGLGLDEDERLLPVPPPPAQDGPDRSIDVSEARADRGGLKDRELMPQGQIFEGQLLPGKPLHIGRQTLRQQIERLADHGLTSP